MTHAERSHASWVPSARRTHLRCDQDCLVSPLMVLAGSALLRTGQRISGAAVAGDARDAAGLWAQSRRVRLAARTPMLIEETPRPHSGVGEGCRCQGAGHTRSHAGSHPLGHACHRTIAIVGGVWVSWWRARCGTQAEQAQTGSGGGGSAPWPGRPCFESTSFA